MLIDPTAWDFADDDTAEPRRRHWLWLAVPIIASYAVVLALGILIGHAL